MDQNQKQQAVEQLRNATTVLVTTNSNPSIDQITASLGLAKFLQKLDKNVTTVITSPVPSSLQFLNAEKDLADNLDSLRDFIVSLDKSLADKLRYKVEGDEVRIFITPYRSRIKKEDIRFSQGDFNVDAVVVIGALNRAEVDAAVLAQSRVLSETPVISITAGSGQSMLGGVNWHDPQASSVSEMIVSVSEALQPGLLDNVSSNILLTGIIAATDHFSNPDTSPKIMTMAAQLMAAGADQQSIMRELKANSPATTSVNAKSIAKQDDSDSSVAIKQDKDSDDKSDSSDSDIKIEHNDQPEDIPADLTSSEDKAAAETAKADTAPPAPALPLVDSKPPEPVAPVVAEPAAPPVPVAPEPPIIPVAVEPAPVQPSVPAPSGPPQPASPAPSQATVQLDEARAAVEAAVAAQPAGTALNPVAGLSTQELPPYESPQPASSGNEAVPSVAPQLGDAPATPPVISPSSASLDSNSPSAVVGSVNPAQLYPEAKPPYGQ